MRRCSGRAGAPDPAEAAAPWLPCVRPLARLDSSCWAAPASPPPVLCTRTRHPTSAAPCHLTRPCVLVLEPQALCGPWYYPAIIRCCTRVGLGGLPGGRWHRQGLAGSRQRRSGRLRQPGGRLRRPAAAQRGPAGVVDVDAGDLRGGAPRGVSTGGCGARSGGHSRSGSGQPAHLAGSAAGSQAGLGKGGRSGKLLGGGHVLRAHPLQSDGAGRCTSAQLTPRHARAEAALHARAPAGPGPCQSRWSRLPRRWPIPACAQPPPLTPGRGSAGRKQA